MNDETLIRASLTEWQQAFCRKDVDALIALYAPGAVLFDAIPPFVDDVAGMREKIIGCLPYFPDDTHIETRNLAVTVGAELAAAHCLWHFTQLPPGHPAGRHWFRSSTVWQKQPDGRWLILHDHCSAPFNPYTERTVLTPDAQAALDAAPESCGGGANPVGWFEIYVADMDRAKAFYSAVFGFEFTRLESPIDLWAFPMQSIGSGAGGALAKMDGFGPGGGGNSVLVYFSCADCSEQADLAARHGGEVVKPKFSIGAYGHIAIVKDSEGNLIGLHSMA